MFVGALLLLGALQAGSPANDAANMADLRCVAILSSALMRVPEAQRPGIQAGVMFFYGRIVGRTPDFDVEERMIGFLKSELQATNLAAEFPRCIKEMQDHGHKLMEIGAHVAAAAKVASPEK